MSETEWFCGVQLGGVKLPAGFPAARSSKSMVHAGTGRWRQKNGRPMLIVGSRLAVYRMAVVEHTNKLDISISDAVVTQTIANVRHANCQAGQMYIVTRLTFKISLIESTFNSQTLITIICKLDIAKMANIGIFFQLCEPTYL